MSNPRHIYKELVPYADHAFTSGHLPAGSSPSYKVHDDGSRTYYFPPSRTDDEINAAIAAAEANYRADHPPEEDTDSE